MASDGSTDHGGLSGRPSPENEPFSLLDIMLYKDGHQGKGDRASGKHCVSRACESSELLHTTLLAPLGNSVPPFLHSLLPHLSLHVSSPASLGRPLLLCSTITHLLIEVRVQITVCHSMFCPDSFPCEYLLQRVTSLGQHFWLLTHCKYWTIAETPISCYSPESG